MRRKWFVLIALSLAIGLAVPTGASAATYNNGVPWNVEADDIINHGRSFLGRPYKYGAAYGNTRYFDCSSFVKYVYRNYITLPRSSASQSKVGKYVAKSNLRKGDLIFFRPYKSSSSRVSHVAIYAGNGTLLHTYGEGGVRFSKLNSGSWNERYLTARRVLQ